MAVFLELCSNYIKLIKQAGFNDIRIIKESPFPIELMASDITAQTVKEDNQISSGKVKIEDYVVSLQVVGIK